MNRIVMCLILMFFTCATARAETGFVSEGGPHSRLIVFVNGLFSNDTGTWTDQKGAYFPKLIADIDPEDRSFQTFDVFVYDLHTEFSPNSPSVAALTKDFLDRLRKADLNAYRHVFFVAHSLGGVVVRKAILEDPSLRKRVDGMLLLGVPTGGSNLADFGSMLFDNNTLDDLRTTQKAGQFLTKLQNDWINAKLGDIESFCVAEREYTDGLYMVVTSESAKELCNASFVDAAGYNHHQLAKPATKKSDQVTWLIRALEYVYPDFHTVNIGGEVVWAHCNPDVYGDRLWKQFASKLSEVTIGGKHVSFHHSKTLDVDWSDADREQLFAGAPPKLIVIHYSCFFAGAQDDPQWEERRVDFLRFLKTFKDDDVKILAYTSAWNGTAEDLVSFQKYMYEAPLDHTFDDAPLLEKDYPLDTRLFLLAKNKGRPDDTVAQRFLSLVKTALGSD